MADGAAAHNRWLFSPLADLVLGCGLAYAGVFVWMSLFGPGFIATNPLYYMPLVSLALSGPHYGATLLRVYERAADRRRYAFFAVWATLMVLVAFAVAVNNPFFGSLFFTLYVTWSPWHYTGQNYGLAVMFLRRRGLSLEPSAKRWLYASFITSYIMTFLVLHGSNEAAGYVPNPVASQGALISFVSLGIPRAFTSVLLGAVTLAYLVCIAAAFRSLSRGIAWRDLGPTAALCGTQALWFSLPFSVLFWKLETGLAPLDLQTHYYVIWIAIGHATQYVWVTTFYARSSKNWTGYSRYLGKAFVAGAAVWTIPAIIFAPGKLGNIEWAAGLALLIAAGVNLHHFILDGAIWKLRDSRVGAVLIRSVPDEEAAETPRPWRRRSVWGMCALATVGAISVIWLNNIGYGMSLEAGDTRATRRIMDTLAFFGHDSHRSRAVLATQLAQNGELTEAENQFRQSLDLRGSSAAWVGLASLRASHQDWSTVVTAYAAIAEFGRPPPGILRNAVIAYYALGRPNEARVVVDELLMRMPETAESQANIANWVRELGDLPSAVSRYRDALAIAPEDAPIGIRLAWLLATTADESVRDAGESIHLAERIVAGTEPPDPIYLDTLAAAYAAEGRFEDAVESAARALSIAKAAGDARLVRVVSKRLARYRAGRPYIAKRFDGYAGSGPSPATDAWGL
jgi:tetratricopeptide (TPR) repeat protein